MCMETCFVIYILHANLNSCLDTSLYLYAATAAAAKEASVLHMFCCFLLLALATLMAFIYTENGGTHIPFSAMTLSKESPKIFL
jgi:hypothetical protein